MPKKINFTVEEEEALIGHVQLTPELWSKQNRGYRKKDKSQEWTEVGLKMDKTGNLDHSYYYYCHQNNLMHFV